jgi:hypothetical protein
VRDSLDELLRVLGVQRADAPPVQPTRIPSPAPLNVARPLFNRERKIGMTAGALAGVVYGYFVATAYPSIDAHPDIVGSVSIYAVCGIVIGALCGVNRMMLTFAAIAVPLGTLIVRGIYNASFGSVLLSGVPVADIRDRYIGLLLTIGVALCPWIPICDRTWARA